MLWVGRRRAAARRRRAGTLGDDLTYTASTAAAVPGVADLWPATADGASARLGEALELAIDRRHDPAGPGAGADRRAVRGGPRRLAPSGADRAARPADAAAAAVDAVLAEQLDLEQVRATEGLSVYRNTAVRAACAGRRPPPVPATGETALRRRAGP